MATADLIGLAGVVLLAASVSPWLLAAYRRSRRRTAHRAALHLAEQVVRYHDRLDAALTSGAPLPPEVLGFDRVQMQRAIALLTRRGGYEFRVVFQGELLAAMQASVAAGRAVRADRDDAAAVAAWRATARETAAVVARLRASARIAS